MSAELLTVRRKRVVEAERLDRDQLMVLVLVGDAKEAVTSRLGFSYRIGRRNGPSGEVECGFEPAHGRRSAHFLQLPEGPTRMRSCDSVRKTGLTRFSPLLGFNRAPYFKGSVQHSASSTTATPSRTLTRKPTPNWNSCSRYNSEIQRLA